MYLHSLDQVSDPLQIPVAPAGDPYVMHLAVNDLKIDLPGSDPGCLVCIHMCPPF